METVIELKRPIVRDGQEMKTVTLRDVTVGDLAAIGPVNVVFISKDGQCVEEKIDRIIEYAVRCGGLTHNEVRGMSMQDFSKIREWAGRSTIFTTDSD